MKKFLTYVCLAVILFVGVYTSVTMAGWARPYEGQNASVSVYDLQKSDGKAYDDSVADGAAGAIVQQNLDKSRAVNDVTSIVFDFRGYDTMGEAFILITAVAGSIVILYEDKKKKAEAVEAEAEEKKAEEVTEA